MNTRSVLGIDLGTSSVKAVLFALADGRTLGSARVPYPIERPEPGAAEQSPDLWWRATVDVVRRAVSNAGHPPIEAIGLTGQMHGLVTLDHALRANRPAVIWADQRSAASALSISDQLGDRLLQIAGSRIAAGFQAASIHWLRATHPERWCETRVALLPKDYLHFRLTGELVTDPGDAAGTLLFDITTRDWSPSLMNAAGIERTNLPSIVEASGAGARLARDAGLALGLPPGLPVVGGGGDAPAAALGAGVTEPGQLLITLSTGAQVYTPLAAPVTDPQGRLHTFTSMFAPGTGGAPWYSMGATLNAGLAFDWLNGLLFSSEAPDDSARMFALAANAPAGANGLLFLPYLAGERTPHFNPNARGAFIGMDASHDRGDLVRAVMEGIDFALFDAWEIVRDVTEANPSRIVVAGGGSRNHFWRKILADLFGLPVRGLREGEQSARGAALIATAALGFDPIDKVTAWVRYEPEQDPDPGAYNAYRSLLDLFRRAYRANAQTFADLVAWRATFPNSGRGRRSN